MMGNPLMNDAQLSQTAGRAKTRHPDLPGGKSAEDLQQIYPGCTVSCAWYDRQSR